ncbi:MAG: cupin domain-containing protein [Desulfurococcaceae archaeon]
MSFVEVYKNVIESKLSKKEAPTAEVAWDDYIYIPGILSAGIADILSGKTIGPEMQYYEVLLILDGEATVKERRTGEEYNISKGDLIVLKKGAKVTITVKKPMRYLYVTVPPHSEIAKVYYLNKEE